MTFPITLALVLLWAWLGAVTNAKCNLREAYPVEPFVMGKMIRSLSTCNYGGDWYHSFLSITESGISWTPLYYHDKFSKTVCPEKIDSVFRRKFAPAELLWTPPKVTSDFKDSHPEIFERFPSVNISLGPLCSGFTQRIRADGKTRPQFVKLVSKMVSGIVHSRNVKCDSDRYGFKSLAENQIMRTNAITYLYNLAYSNHFCVKIHAPTLGTPSVLGVDWYILGSRTRRLTKTLNAIGKMAADPSRTYGSITLAGQASAQGTLRISATGFAWKGREQTGRVVSVTRDELDSVKWLRGGRGQQIRVARKGGSYVMFEGFRASDLTELREFLNQVVGVELTHAAQAVRGWSWGQLDVTSGMAPSLAFRAGGGEFEKHNAKALEDAFDLPLGRVSNVQLPNPNEIAIDLHVDDTAGKMDEELVEVRFFVPDGVKAEDVHDRIKERADTSAFAGESICSFNQMGVIVPRGRYDIDLFPNHIKLRGKAVDFKILYSSITRLFLLPKPDNVLVSFVMSLDPPVRQGNTMYPHIVFQFDTEDKSAVQLHIDEDVLKDKYKGKLSKGEEGYTWRVFSKVVKNLSSSPLHVPKTFRTSRNGSAVRTALGPNEGFLFFLESCCFFVNKPPTYIRYDDIDFVDFRRMELERRFDMFIALSTSNTTYTFTNIERNEFDIIFKFLHDSKNVPIENAEHLKRTGGRSRVTLVDENDDSESDDDDFDPNAKPGDGDRKRGHDVSDGSGGDSSGSGSDDDDYVALDEDELEHVKENKSDGARPSKRAK